MILCEQSRRKLIPIASGKGGVGKSMLTANLGILLAAYGKRTVVADLDLGGSNLHTYLGLKNTRVGIGNYLNQKELTFDRILQDTDYPNLWFVPGDVLVAGSAGIMVSQRRTLIRNLEKLDVDFVLMDLGSGTHQNVMDFFLASNCGVLVTNPQSPSVLNAYGFLKNAVFRELQRRFANEKRIAEYLKSVQNDSTPNSTPKLTEITQRIAKYGKSYGARAEEVVRSIRPFLVVNMLRNPEEFTIINGLRELTRRNLALDLGCLGTLFHDERVVRSLREQKPFIEAAEDSFMAAQLNRIAQKLVQSPRFPEMPLSLDEYSDSFELAQIELVNDFERCAGEPIEDEASVGGDVSMPEGISDSDLVALISAQKQEIEDLKTTIRNLTLGSQQR